MLNQVVLVGRIKEIPVIKETATGVKLAEVLVDVERNYKNAMGVIEYVTIKCTMWRGLADTIMEEGSVGTLIGIKGRLDGISFRDKNDNNVYYSEVIAEKINFLNPMVV